ncbi:MAG: TrmO family methyltransferase domain-containing protein [Promethearchaeota archaeon]
MNKIKNSASLHNQNKKLGSKLIGIFAMRAPINTNLIGLTLVELINREENILMVRDFDAFNDTPILDIKPYPDWEQGYYSHS